MIVGLLILLILAVLFPGFIRMLLLLAFLVFTVGPIMYAAQHMDDPAPIERERAMKTYDQVSAGDKFKMYLGDGVYVSFDGHQIWLRTERETGWHEIAIEPRDIEALRAYAVSCQGDSQKTEDTELDAAETKHRAMMADLAEDDDERNAILKGPGT